MVRPTASDHFEAALGLERSMERAVQAHLRHFHHKILFIYQREIRHERASLMRQTPMDYRRIRSLDRELEDVTTLLRDMDMAERRS